MTENLELTRVSIAMSRTYQIRLKGHLDGRGQEWLGTFSMTLLPIGETVLTGTITDQAALFGILLKIRDLGIPLLSVNEVDSSSKISADC